MTKHAPKLPDALQERRRRRNVRALAKYFALVAAIVVLYSVLFELIMVQVEGQRHGWITAV